MKRLFIIMALITAAGCAKVPDRLESPRITIRVVIEQNRPSFVMTILAGLRNDNSDVAFFDYEGEVILKDRGGALKKSAVTAIPFRVPRIFPFETVPLNVEVKGTEDEFRPVFDLLELNQDEIVKSGGTEEIYIQDENMELATRSYRKAGIDSLLEGK